MDIKIENQEVDAQTLQERTLENLRELQKVSQRALRMYTGLWVLAYDETKTMLDRVKELLDKAEERGGDVEEQALEEIKKYYKQTEEQVDELRTRATKQFEQAESEAEEEVDSRIKRALRKLDIPTRESVLALNAKIDELTRRIDEELLGAEAAVVEEALKGYDALTAKEIVNRLDALTIAELKAVKLYETAQEKRVTILREVDRRLEAFPIANYDKLTVEEIEPLLNTLDVEQLEQVRTYEAAHENRVTLLRAIDDELEERKEMVA